MEILIKAAQLILSLSILIILHELGHFIPARLFKTRVEKFFLFFDAWGKKLFSIKKGETEYGIGWLPLGGYVKISGMIDESMDKEYLEKPAEPWEFRSKPAWQRLIIMLGGVIVNFILGFLIYIMILSVWGDDQVKVGDVHNGFAVSKTFKDLGFKNGDNILNINGNEPENILSINEKLFLRNVETITVSHPNGSIETINIPKNIGEIMWTSGEMRPFKPRTTSIIDYVDEGSPANKAGLKEGDQIITANQQPIKYWNELTDIIQSTLEPIKLEVLRNGQTLFIDVTPDEENTIGIAQKESILAAVTVTHKSFSLSESISGGFDKAYWKLKDYITQFKYVFTKKGAESLGGFISIGNHFSPTWDWHSFWNFTAFLSIMLGFMNLLPIPALDGGHVLFTLWEMISGKKPSDKFLEYAQIAGFVLLMSLLIYVNGNDIYKLFAGKM